ncbi:MAG: hypothetical protein AAF380_00610 [Bacteroidota bacterium]
MTSKKLTFLLAIGILNSINLVSLQASYSGNGSNAPSSLRSSNLENSNSKENKIYRCTGNISGCFVTKKITYDILLDGKCPGCGSNVVEINNHVAYSNTDENQNSSQLSPTPLAHFASSMPISSNSNKHLEKYSNQSTDLVSQLSNQVPKRNANNSKHTNYESKRGGKNNELRHTQSFSPFSNSSQLPPIHSTYSASLMSISNNSNKTAANSMTPLSLPNSPFVSRSNHGLRSVNFTHPRGSSTQNQNTPSSLRSNGKRYSPSKHRNTFNVINQDKASMERKLSRGTEFKKITMPDSDESKDQGDVSVVSNQHTMKIRAKHNSAQPASADKKFQFKECQNKNCAYLERSGRSYARYCQKAKKFGGEFGDKCPFCDSEEVKKVTGPTKNVQNIASQSVNQNLLPNQATMASEANLSSAQNDKIFYDIDNPDDLVCPNKSSEDCVNFFKKIESGKFCSECGHQLVKRSIVWNDMISKLKNPNQSSSQSANQPNQFDHNSDNEDIATSPQRAELARYGLAGQYKVNSNIMENIQQMIPGFGKYNLGQKYGNLSDIEIAKKLEQEDNNYRHGNFNTYANSSAPAPQSTGNYAFELVFTQKIKSPIVGMENFFSAFFLNEEQYAVLDCAKADKLKNVINKSYSVLKKKMPGLKKNEIFRKKLVKDGLGKRYHKNLEKTMEELIEGQKQLHSGHEVFFDSINYAAIGLYVYLRRK